MNLQNLLLDIEQHIQISAPIDKVFEGLVHRLTEGNINPNDEPMPMRLERRPGGRWFRDLGDDKGHLWGIVQSIKPPALLEIFGPMFMSYPVSGHLIIRLEPDDAGTHLSLRHRALGLIDEEHRQGLADGWRYYLDGVKKDCE